MVVAIVHLCLVDGLLDQIRLLHEVRHGLLRVEAVHALAKVLREGLMTIVAISLESLHVRDSLAL